MANWTVSPLYRKSCEEHLHYTKLGQTITRQTGYRSASFYVETTDDNPPQFEFRVIPGGNGQKDSINIYDCAVNNIQDAELDAMWDGCWEEIVYPEDMHEDEQVRLEELIEESFVDEVLEEQEGWDLAKGEVWIWGPIQIESEAGDVVRVIVADAEGNAVDFVEEQDD